MQKCLIQICFFTLLLNSNSIWAKTKLKEKKKSAIKVEEIKNKEVTASKAEAPCDKKEDILKKLEEEKKKQSAFSLQGGNTGCSIDKK